MAIGTQLQWASTTDLMLDPMNPRLGRHHMDPATAQDQLLVYMRDWSIEELAESFLQSGGFWSHEALLAVREELYGASHIVVVEGNRRLAALRCLKAAVDGEPLSRRWKDIAGSAPIPATLFSRVPYLLADSRADVQAFIGFRHVTGIKQWEADEKAGFIAHLIEHDGLTYDQVRRKIGSHTPAVRHHYIAYRLLLQIEDTVESYPREKAESRFTILYDSLRTEGVRKFLGVDMTAEPASAKRPVTADKAAELRDFSVWVFGTKEQPPLVTDTRLVAQFSQILSSHDALIYLRGTKEPQFEVALRVAGGDEAEVTHNLEQAAYHIEVSLMRVHAFKDSDRVRKSVKRVVQDADQLLVTFPGIQQEF